MNNLRDGSRRHRITKGQVNYYPNRFEQAPPASDPVKDMAYAAHKELISKAPTFKTTARGEKFKEYLSMFNSLFIHPDAHYLQAKRNSSTTR